LGDEVNIHILNQQVYRGGDIHHTNFETQLPGSTKCSFSVSSDISSSMKNQFVVL